MEAISGLLTAFIAALGGAGVVLAALAYFGKSALELLVASRLETHKASLSQDLQHLKSDLAKLQFEHQTRFSTMHQKRAEVIATLYGKLADARLNVHALVNLVQSVSQDPDAREKAEFLRKQVAADAWNDAMQYFFRHEIFLSEEVASRTEQLVTLMRASIFDYAFAQEKNGDKRKWLDAFNRMQTEVPEILQGLKRDYRNTLGISEA